MIIEVYFDASFIAETCVAGISVVIKTDGGKLILQSSKKVLCKSSSEAEFRALNKAVGYINNKQSKGLFAKNCHIKIYGDNQGIIEIAKRMRSMKGIEKGLMHSFLKEINTVKKNNRVVFLWILRNENIEAHSIAKDVLNKNLLRSDRVHNI
ncbi:MAG: reverse transcriptase-like protein [Clostridia bacterium]|nr:reverse transcriptase-like protein [Clostridia bacterium]